MTNSILEMNSVSRSFGDVAALQGLTFRVEQSEFVAVVGPSGCGKTTLLNLLSGYDAPTSGQVTRRGSVRMVYQHDGLFPWLTAGQNIDVALRKLASDADRNSQRQALLNLIGLEGFADHYPHQLSGGMRQRVELARALAGETDLLLMDEPFSALDYLTRLRMRDELARLLQKRPITVVLVTHDIEEAAQLADRVIVLSGRPGRILCEHALTGARPRELTNPEVTNAVQTILFDLGLGMNRPANGAANEAMK